MNISFILSMALSILVIVAEWKLFTKAGEAGWKSLIPIYNCYILFKIAKNEGFGKMLGATILGALLYCIGLGMILAGSSFGVIIFIVGAAAFIFALVIQFKMYADLSLRFGKEKVFAWGLLFLSPIFICILAFDSSNYDGLVHAVTDSAEPSGQAKDCSEEVETEVDADSEIDADSKEENTQE